MPFAARGDQVISGHLVAPPAALRHLELGVGRVARDIDVAGGGQRLVGAVLAPQLLDRPAGELVDIADIVGEQHVALGVVGRRAGIVAQPRQAEIDARRVEQRQRPLGLAAIIPGAVGDLVADMDELGRREGAGELGGAAFLELQVLAAVEHVGIGYLAPRPSDRDLDLIVADEIAELLAQIFPEHARPGDAGRVAAGMVQPAEGARREFLGQHLHMVDAKLGIGEQALGASARSRDLAGGQILRERVAEIGDRFVIDGAKLIDDLRDVVDRRDQESCLLAFFLRFPAAYVKSRGAGTAMIVVNDSSSVTGFAPCDCLISRSSAARLVSPSLP